MRCILILVTALLAFPLVACGETEEDKPAVGRYSITYAAEGVYFLDTATGTLWLKTTSDEWRQVDSPVVRAPATAKRPPKQVSLTLPKSGETMPMIQRERRTIPGSSETLSVQLGDITGGQVFVEVIDINGDYLVKRTSLKDDEFLKFEVDDQVVYLQVVDMVNNLIGDDICKIHLSYKKPKSDDASKALNEAKSGDQRD